MGQASTKIIKLVFLAGREVTSKQLSEETGKSIPYINMTGKRLVARRLFLTRLEKEKRPNSNFVTRRRFWSINPAKIEKIKYLIATEL